MSASSSGSYRKNPDTGKVTQFDAQVSLAGEEDSYIGNVNAYWSNQKLKYNLSDIEVEYLVCTVQAVTEVVSKLESAE